MIGWLKERIKWWIAGKEMAELNRWRFQHNYYRLCLYDIDPLRETLESLEARVKMQSVNICLPPPAQGPLGVDGLRYRWEAHCKKIIEIAIIRHEENTHAE